MLGWLKKKNKLLDASAEVRLAALPIADINDPETVGLLEKMSHSDPDERVRIAAISQLPASSTFDDLLQNPLTKDATAERMVELVRQQEKWHWLSHETVFIAFLRNIQPNELNRVKPFAQNAQHLAELALALPKARCDDLLSPANFPDEASLAVLERASRGRDKTVNRFARQSLEDIKSRQSAYKTLAQRCMQIDESLAKQSQDFVRLQKLLAARETIEAELSSLRDKNTFSLNEPLTLPDPPLTQATLAARIESAETAKAEAAALVVLAEKAREVAQAEGQQATVQDELLQISAQEKLASSFWQCLATALKLEDQAGIDDEISVRNKLIKKIRREIEHLAWPTSHPEPDLLVMARNGLTDLSASLAQLHQSIDAREIALEAALHEIDKAINDGQTRTIGQSMKHARSLLQRIPRERDSAKKAERQIAQFSSQLAELRDWQKFATDPKREALLTEIQALANNPSEPPTQATRLKNLRSRWQQLGRPTSSAAHGQQQKFDTLADQAFEPCKAYFAEQERMRGENLATRVALCEQLADYLAQTEWQDADFKAAEQIMRTAREEWRKYHPCERKALKTVEERFEGLQSELYGHLKAHWNANVAAKKSIVETASKLIESDDTADQAAQVKELQRRWQQVGSTPGSIDQRLWREFRKSCDAVFAKRGEVFAQQKQQRQADIQALFDAIEIFETAAKRANDALDASAKEFDQLNQSITAMAADLLKGDASDRLRAARENYQQALARRKTQAVREDIERLKQHDIDLSGQEMTGEDTARSSHDNLYNACLRLTLESELAADQPSPSENQTQRMALQIEFMNAGRRDLAAKDPKVLIAEWHQIGPKSKDEDALRERFFAAILTRLS